MMKFNYYYQCPNCKTKYLECDLTKTICSENGIETYIVKYCPKCMNKRWPILSELQLKRNKNV